MTADDAEFYLQNNILVNGGTDMKTLLEYIRAQTVLILHLKEQDDRRSRTIDPGYWR